MALDPAEKQEFPPLLNVGFHSIGLTQLRRLCVDRFPLSATRQGIMKGLEELIELMNKQLVQSSVWIDGSFLTQKLNPNDVDLVWVIDAHIFVNLSKSQRAFFDWYRNNRLKAQYKCDNYPLIVDQSSPESQWMTAYWLRQFGFSRSDQMKGMAVLRLPLVVTP